MAQTPHTGERAHTSTATYVRVFGILFVVTVVEVGVFYVPAFKAILVPLLLSLSALKFALVVMFYMHLKQDSRLFTFIFGGPLLMAAAVMIGLLFLFGAVTLGR
jgi:cytochrome c oxidase subunit 4